MIVFSYYPSDPRPRRAAEALAQAGAEIDYLCLRRDPVEPKQETANGMNVYRVPLKRRRGGIAAYLFQYAVFLLAATAFLTKHSFRRRHDLVHVHNMPDILVFSALIPKLLGSKIILDLHDPMPELMETIYMLDPQSFAVRFMKRCEQWSIRFADLVLTPNEAFKRLFKSRSCPSEKLQIVMNTPEEKTFLFRPLDLSIPVPRKPDQPFTILYHGSLVARHGLDLAIDALEIVRKSIPHAVILICGENTPYFEKVLALAQQRGLQNAVRYLGMKSHRQIAETIMQCDLGVIPNRLSVFTEINLPTRIFEYLALGKPVVAPRTAGIRDYFSNDAILFFKPDDTADLADKIIWSFHNPAAVATLVRRGQAVYQKHRWSEERQRFLALVNGLIGKSSAGGDSANFDDATGNSSLPAGGRLLPAAAAVPKH